MQFQELKSCESLKFKRQHSSQRNFLTHEGKDNYGVNDKNYRKYGYKFSRGYYYHHVLLFNYKFHNTNNNKFLFYLAG